MSNDVRQPGSQGRTQTYTIDMTGTVMPIGADENAYRVTFEGGFELNAVYYEDGGETRDEGHMNTQGSVQLKLGQTKTIAQNGDATLTLTVMRLEESSAV